MMILIATARAGCQDGLPRNLTDSWNPQAVYLPGRCGWLDGGRRHRIRAVARWGARSRRSADRSAIELDPRSALQPIKTSVAGY